MATSLHQFCKYNGLSKTSVHRWLTDQGFDLSQGMTQDAIAAAREQFLPGSDDSDGIEAVTPTAVETAITRIDSHTNPLVPIHIGTLNLSITHANTGALETETAQFQQVSAQALQGIGEYLQADLVSSVQSAIAQNRHAVAGLNAAAAANLANGLGKPQADGEAA